MNQDPEMRFFISAVTETAVPAGGLQASWFKNSMLLSLSTFFLYPHRCSRFCFHGVNNICLRTAAVVVQAIATLPTMLATFVIVPFFAKMKERL